MSFLAVAWAETAPVKDVYERAIITLMAHRASSDGTGCWRSIATMADYACCDATTIKRRLAAMRERGLIAYGDQKLVKHLPRDKRPKVYDLLIPYGWYSATQLEEVTADRAGRGLPPLTEAERPALRPVMASGRKTRADAGVARPGRRKQATIVPSSEEDGLPSSDSVSEGTGVLIAPPVDNPTGESNNGHGGAISTVAGVLRNTSRGCYKHPNTVLPPTGEDSPVNQSPGGRAAAPQTPADRKPDSPQSVVTDQLESVGDPHYARAPAAPAEQPADGRPTGFESWGIGALLNELGVQAIRLADTTGRDAFQAAQRQAALRQECRRRGIRAETIEHAEFGTPDEDIDGQGQELARASPTVVVTRTGKRRAARRRSRR